MPTEFGIVLIVLIISAACVTIVLLTIIKEDTGSNVGYNYDKNIQYINARLGSTIKSFEGSEPYAPPPLPSEDPLYAKYPPT